MYLACSSFSRSCFMRRYHCSDIIVFYMLTRKQHTKPLTHRMMVPMSEQRRRQTSVVIFISLHYSFELFVKYERTYSIHSTQTQTKVLHCAVMVLFNVVYIVLLSKPYTIQHLFKTYRHRLVTSASLFHGKILSINFKKNNLQTLLVLFDWFNAFSILNKEN